MYAHILQVDQDFLHNKKFNVINENLLTELKYLPGNPDSPIKPV